MTAQYLVRLDDACPTADWKQWRRLEGLLDAAGIRPIVAVIPDNRQPPPRAPRDDFWQQVGSWAAKGWTLGLHGLDHVYVTRRRGLVPINDFSEFAGLPLAEQRSKIRRAWKIFLARGIEPRVWVAPGHSFDENTLRALHAETDIRVVSDGLALRTFSAHGFRWLPQQLWRFRRMPFGTWTICLHPDTLTEPEWQDLEQAVSRHREHFIGFEDVRWSRRPRGLADRLFAAAFLGLLRMRQRGLQPAQQADESV